jgi:hypothetical protein
MSARRESGKDHFDLLPFIAILMCVLGCLLLVTMSIAAISIGPGLGEGWIPGESDRDSSSKIPVLIEWDGKMAVVHRNGARQELAWATPKGNDVDPPEASVRAEFDAFLQDMARKRATHYALIAVRPSGFENFARFAYEFRRNDITLGSEPIDQNKPVRLLPARNKQ